MSYCVFTRGPFLYRNYDCGSRDISKNQKYELNIKVEKLRPLHYTLEIEHSDGNKETVFDDWILTPLKRISITTRSGSAVGQELLKVREDRLLEIPRKYPMPFHVIGNVK